MPKMEFKCKRCGFEFEENALTREEAYKRKVRHRRHVKCKRCESPEIHRIQILDKIPDI